MRSKYIMSDYTIKELRLMSHATAKKYAKLQNIPNAKKRVIEKNPPKCLTKRCNNSKAVSEWHWISGKPLYRSVCKKCFTKNLLNKHGVKSLKELTVKRSGFSSTKEYMDNIAIEAGYESHLDKLNKKAIEKGFDSYTDEKNKNHPYLKYRKSYCENVDGRLGYTCTTSIFWKGMLDIDHINGKPTDNRPKNLQTLCKCCHAYKTNKYKDYSTPGRKRLKDKNKIIPEANIFSNVLNYINKVTT